MTIENLISTMNKTKPLIVALIKQMRVNKYVVINQITNNKITPYSDRKKVFSYRERGLSKSRNKALTHSTADICIISDDDMYYEPNYIETIKKAYEKYEDADIIAFVVDNMDAQKKKKVLKEGRLGYIGALRLQSVQITFKRENIISNGIYFDERFGTGSEYFWGEENIFLYDCLHKGLKLYYVPQKIATLNISESSWRRDNIYDHFAIQGAVYYRMSPAKWMFLSAQHVIRHFSKYRKDISVTKVIKALYTGAVNFEKTTNKS